MVKGMHVKNCQMSCLIVISPEGNNKANPASNTEEVRIITWNVKGLNPGVRWEFSISAKHLDGNVGKTTLETETGLG